MIREPETISNDSQRLIQSDKEKPEHQNKQKNVQQQIQKIEKNLQPQFINQAKLIQLNIPNLESDKKQPKQQQIDNQLRTQSKKSLSVLEQLFEQLRERPLPKEPQTQDKQPIQYFKKPKHYTDDYKPRFQFRTFNPNSKLIPKESPFSKQKNWTLGTGKTKDKLRIWSWNINGIRSRNAIKLLLHHSRPVNPDIICIIETKINYDAYKKDPIHFQGYNDYWSFCKCSAGYSGVAVLSKYPPLRVAEDLPQLEFSQQGRVLTLQFQQFYLVAVYVPAAGDHLQRLFFKVKQYEVAFHNYCNELKKNKNVIIAGDLNTARSELDASISKTTHQGQAFTPLERKSMEDFLKTGWIDTYRYFHPDVKTISWWNLRRYGQKALQCKKGKRLDYFLVDKPFISAVCTSKVMNHITGRDHCPIQLKMDIRYYKQLKTIKSLNKSKNQNEQQEKC